MSRPTREARDLADAAAVHVAREEIVEALGPLAARPLDEQAAVRMRLALERVQSPAVRLAIRRLGRPGESRPPLMAVGAALDGGGAVRLKAPAMSVRVHQLVPAYAPGGAA